METQPRSKPPMRRSLISALIGVALLGSGFYWYQLRPMDIRSDCALDASKRAFIDEGQKGEPGSERLRVQNEAFETYYNLCVRSHGLAN